ncbi:hypothetical protein F66182_4157 [Fusarium sp. NRRL 66182]|nr:hypothetical protein F66182_4157 [Fusarium sp. NRRL 66182]
MATPVRLEPAKAVAVLGAGTIGASWAALFATHGLETTIYDPNPNAEASMWEVVVDAVQTLARIEPSPPYATLQEASRRISFTTDLEKAVATADVIQENVPEILDLKLELFAKLEVLIKDTTLVLSSTSGIQPSKLQDGFKRLGSNLVVGHPFNPPHLLPLVEVVGGSQSSEESIQRAIDFYASLGKKPVRVRCEIQGHIANRLQAALFREIMYLLQNDIATVSEIDTALEYGPGLRWGVMGASLLLHLGGGPEGARGYGNKFMPHLMSWYAPQDPLLDQELVDRWVQETLAEAGDKTGCLERRRDEALVQLINTKNRSHRTMEPSPPPKAS